MLITNNGMDECGVILMLLLLLAYCIIISIIYLLFATTNFQFVILTGRTDVSASLFQLIATHTIQVKHFTMCEKLLIIKCSTLLEYV